MAKSLEEYVKPHLPPITHPTQVTGLKNREIEAVEYEVTHDFALSLKGEVRRAYAITKHVDNENCLLFHPASRGECGSVEMAKPNQRGNYVSLTEESYLNLSSANNKIYRQMVEEAGFQIPSDLVLKAPISKQKAKAKKTPTSKTRHP